MPLRWELQIHTTVLVTFGKVQEPGVGAARASGSVWGVWLCSRRIGAREGWCCEREAAQGPQGSAGMTN